MRKIEIRTKALRSGVTIDLAGTWKPGGQLLFTLWVEDDISPRDLARLVKWLSHPYEDEEVTVVLV